MIHVNLLLTDRHGHAGPDLRHLAFAAGGVAVVLVAILVVGIRYVSTATNLRAEERRQEEILRKQKQQLAEIDKFKLERKEYEEKIAVIDRLKERQLGPVHILDEISRCLPEKVWLTELQQKGSELTIKGSALTIGDIVAFVSHLKESQYFSSELEIKESSQAKIADQEVYQFTIVGTLPSGSEKADAGKAS